MRLQGKVRGLLIGAVILLAAIRICGGVASDLRFLTDSDFGFDQRMRRNEVRCAHQGINSFRIWNRETTLPGFAPLPCPGREKVVKQAGDGTVHAYPPWHTAFFWLYGWLPSEVLCLSLMAAVFGVCLLFVVYESVRISRTRFEETEIVVGLSLAAISLPAVQCFILLNYCVLILAAFLLMNRALEKGHDVFAGLAWAVMMVKPQVGLLFVWPLFWHRRFLTIATAATVCLAATAFTSFAVHEPMIDLILQIPQIGLPYAKDGTIIIRLLTPLVGENANLVGMAFFFVLTGLFTGFLRKRTGDFLTCCVPVALIVPVWTYCSCYDLVILLPALLLVWDRILSSHGSTVLKAAGCALYAESVFSGVWSLVCGLGVFDPTGRGWIYRLAEYGSYAAMLALIVLFVRDTRRTAPSLRAHSVNPAIP